MLAHIVCNSNIIHILEICARVFTGRVVASTLVLDRFTSAAYDDGRYIYTRVRYNNNIITT